MLCNKLLKDCMKASQLDQWIEHWPCYSKVLCKEERSEGTVDCPSKLQTRDYQLGLAVLAAIRLLDTIRDALVFVSIVEALINLSLESSKIVKAYRRSNATSKRSWHTSGYTSAVCIW